MNWYYKLVARRPYFVLISVGIACVAFTVVALVYGKLPNFGDPTSGFEARGTSIGKRWTAWQNLLEETSPFGQLVANPQDFIYRFASNNLLNSIREPKPQKNRKKAKSNLKKLDLNKKIRLLKELALNHSSEGEVVNYGEYDDDTFASMHDNWEYGKNTFYSEDYNKTNDKKRAWARLKNWTPPANSIEVHIPSDGFFCESPNKEYAHFVVQRINHNLNDSMFELDTFMALCDLEQRIIKAEYYAELCQKELTTDNCCRPWSVVNYVTFLSNKTSCLELNEEDIAMVKTLLFDCFPYYHNMKLSNDCVRSSCKVPEECKQHNAVYNILHYLADSDFIKLNESAEFLNATMIFLPIARSTTTLKLFNNLRQENLGNEQVSVVAMDMGLKNALFDECLLQDGWLIGLGGLFVVISMCFYTKSVFITLMTVVAVIFSLGIAYFTYTLIFKLSFFPFMNLLAVVVVVGIGADDAFIFIKIWQCLWSERAKETGTVCSSGPSTSADVLSTRSDRVVDVLGKTLKHSALSMLVTSLTTAAAFYASFVSSITAVRCFGIFAGTAVIANYFLMMTWLPASVSVAERIAVATWYEPVRMFIERVTQPLTSISQLGQKLEKIIISIIIKVPLLWIMLLGILGILSGITVLGWPKLRLPDSPDFKLFISSHPFERYDSVYKNLFWFEKMYSTSESFKLPLRFVWGIQPVDNGNYLDPEKRGSLILDNNFDMSAQESQQFLLHFCRDLKNQSFYQMSYGLLLPNCFIENFITWMTRRCNDSMGQVDRTPCCESSPFPFAPEIFNQCLPESISSLYATPREFFIPGVAGPKFSRPSNGNDSSPPHIRAVVIEYESNQDFTMSYTEMDKFVNIVESWFKRVLEQAPTAMKNAWFISELEFFDLQDTLSTGTIVAICVAMSVALLILMLVTLNVLISLYAIMTVTFTILTTVAVLVLLGWRLNILESVAVSTAIGLAVDFSLHYGVQYQLAPGTDRKSSTQFSLERMMGPTALAATTTGVAGALMLPSSVLPYIQIGIFLVIVMLTSWVYATFFLMSLLYIFGPEGDFGQFDYKKCSHVLRSKTQTDDSTQASYQPRHNMVTDQLLSNSSSAAGELIGSESHELDSLTSSSIIKPPTQDTSKSTNFDKAFKKKSSVPRDQSPSTASGITMVLPDDIDNNG